MSQGDGRDSVFDDCWHAESGWVLASLISYLGDINEAQDALQDAWVKALERWPIDGVPNNPRGWLMTVSRRAAIDRVRKQQSAQQYQSREIPVSDSLVTGSDDVQPVDDDMLRLIFTCCHPALKHEAKVALTLNTVCGMNVEEIANAFLVSKATMAQRLVRVKKKISMAGIAYKVPEKQQINERLEAVRATIYLLFNEAYLPRISNDLYRSTLCDLSVELGRLLLKLDASPENAGLLALMLLHDSRRETRFDKQTERYVPLSEQNRERWDQAKIREGQSLLLQALGKRQPGPYQIQAAISAVHAEAASYETTDWQQLLGLYDALTLHQPSPVVNLNRALVIAEYCRVEDALPLLKAERNDLSGYQPWHAAFASLSERAGHYQAAREAYRDALSMTTNQAESRYLEQKLAELQARLI